MNFGRIFILRLVEAIMAVVIHLMHAGSQETRNAFASIVQNTLYSCWIVLLGARLDAEMFELEGLYFYTEMFATLGGGICYALAGISTFVNLQDFGRQPPLITKGVFAEILSIILFVEFIILIIDR